MKLAAFALAFIQPFIPATPWTSPDVLKIEVTRVYRNEFVGFHGSSKKKTRENLSGSPSQRLCRQRHRRELTHRTASEHHHLGQL
jgi:hypothetical protein